MRNTIVLWKELLSQGLADDGWTWDWTTLGVPPSKKPLKARIIAKSDGIWAGEGLSAALSQVAFELGFNGAQAMDAVSKFEDGGVLKHGTVVSEWVGPARAVLALERPFLNLAAYASGIATVTQRLVSEVKKACPKRPPRVTSTRKILPHYRDLAIHGVRVGGGHAHRVSLSGGVLIKENHIAAAGGIGEAIRGARATAPHGLKIEIEVRNEQELVQALSAKADGVLLDNFTPAQVRTALKRIGRSPIHPFIEVSGGINEQTIGDYAIEGVDVISVGSLTHSVKAIDLSLLVKGT